MIRPKWGLPLWLRFHLPMKGTWVWSLIRENSTFCGATKPCGPSRTTITKVYLPGVCALQQEKPLQWEAHAPHQESSPHPPQLEKAHLQQRRPSAAHDKKIIIMIKIKELFQFWYRVSSVQSLSHVRLFVTPWAAACCILVMYNLGDITPLRWCSPLMVSHYPDIHVVPCLSLQDPTWSGPWAPL